MNRRIRVAHLITNFVVGGAQDYLLLIVRGLDLERFEPILAGRLEGEWVELLRSIPGVESVDIPALHREISPWNDLKSIFQIKKFCKDSGIDILHTHSSKPGVVGRIGAHLAGVPGIVHTVHGFSFHNFMPAWKKYLFVWTERWMSRYTTTLILYSQGDRRTAARYRIGARKSVETFYYGIDHAPFDEQFDRDAVRRSFGFDPSNYVIGFTGRFSDQKALHILIGAFAEVCKIRSQARLLLVGHGSLQERLEDQAARLGISDKIVITGFRADIPRVLAAMDLFVMTSFWEGLSRSLIEAMYARLPVIATDVGGTSDAVRNGETGWLIPPNRIDAAVEAMTAAMTDPVRTKALADRAHEWARKTFDLRTMNLRMARLYESIAQNNCRGRNPSPEHRKNTGHIESAP